MNATLLDPIIAAMPQEYYPQGALAEPYPDFLLFLVAAVCLAMFFVRFMRPSSRPQRFFSPDFALAIAPILCASVSLVLDLFRILDVNGRVVMSDALLEHRIGYALRPFFVAAIASAGALLILFATTVQTRNEGNASMKEVNG